MSKVFLVESKGILLGVYSDREKILKDMRKINLSFEYLITEIPTDKLLNCNMNTIEDILGLYKHGHYYRKFKKGKI